MTIHVMNKSTFSCCPVPILLVLVFATTLSMGDIYDRCFLVDDNTVIVKLKGGVSIKLTRKGGDIYLQQKTDDDGRWLSSVDDPNAFRMIMKFVKLGRFSGCRRRIFSQKPVKPTAMKKPRTKMFRNGLFF